MIPSGATPISVRNLFTSERPSSALSPLQVAAAAAPRICGHSIWAREFSPSVHSRVSVYIFWLGFIVFAAIKLSGGDSSLVISTAGSGSPIGFRLTARGWPVTVIPVAARRSFNRATNNSAGRETVTEPLNPALPTGSEPLISKIFRSIFFSIFNVRKVPAAEVMHWLTTRTTGLYGETFTAHG